MKIFAIYAYEQQFLGLHGMYGTSIVELTSLDEAIEWAIEESLEIMESYPEIIDMLKECAISEGLEEGTEEYEEYMEELKKVNIGYEIWEVTSPYELEKMNEDFYNNIEDFISKYCK